MKRIGVVSDTHIPMRAKALPPELFTGLAGVDLILHAGDIASMDVLGDLAAIAPVQAVYGNIDPFEVRHQLPRTRVLEEGGKRIGLIHGDGTRLSTPERALRAFGDKNVDAVVFGHSHQPLCERRGGILLFNPGSPTDRRFCATFSFGILTVSETSIDGEIHRFGP